MIHPRLFYSYPSLSLSLSACVTTEFCLLDLSVIYIAKGRVRRDSIYIRYLSYLHRYPPTRPRFRFRFSSST